LAAGDGFGREPSQKMLHQPAQMARSNRAATRNRPELLPMIIDDVKAMTGTTLQLGDRARRFDADTGLFGGIPEFDSMAVGTLVSAIETRFGLTVEDEEITADTFATVGSLTHYIEGKLAQ
jgi:acyl carrier protein